MVYLVRSEEQLREEYKGLYRLQRLPGIIGLYVVNPTQKSICLELAEGGSVHSKRHEMSREVFLRVAFEAACALTNMHSEELVHRDFKAENLLLTRDNQVRLTDFSTVVEVKDFDSREIKGTVRCFAPETAATITKDLKKADVWAFGVFLWEQMKKQECKIPIDAPHFGKDLEMGGPTLFKLGGIAIQLRAKAINAFLRCEIEDSLDPEKVEKFDPDNVLVPLIKRCLSYHPMLRPDMTNIRDELEQEIEMLRQ